MERLMSLQGYVHQLRPRKESYVNHVDKIQNLLEAKKPRGAEFENIICMYFLKFKF